LGTDPISDPEIERGNCYIFTVLGYLNGISYAVQVGVDVRQTHPRQAIDGVVVGDPRAIGLLQTLEGLPVRPGPGMRSRTGTNKDPEWVLACLHAHTQVTDVYGEDIPDLGGGRGWVPGAVY
jgi:hypothetical protein